MSTLAQRQVRLARIDARATALYDKLNPNWEREIRVSKAECIRRVAGDKRYGPKPKPFRTARPLTAKQRAIVENRTIIRAAFDKVRYDPDEKAVRANLLDALGGRIKITEMLLETARQIARGDNGE